MTARRSRKVSPRAVHAPRERAGREALVAAATEEFANLGYAGATTAGIARRAGLTQPLVYHHFGSKRGLWLAVIDGLFADLEKELDDAARAALLAPPLTRVAQLLRVFVMFSGARPQLPRLIRTESRAGGGAFDELYRRWLARLIGFFRREIDLAQTAGAVRPLDASLVYFVIVGAATEPFIQPETARRAFALDVTNDELTSRYADVVVDVLLRGLSQKH